MLMTRYPPRLATELGNEFSTLIARYPTTSRAEVERLIKVYPRLQVLDVALMMADDRLAPLLDKFCEQHRDRLRPPLSLRLGAALVFAAALVALALLAS